MPAAPGARNVSPLLGGSGGIGQGYVSPVYAQQMAALSQPITWGGAPPGQMYGAGYGPQNQPVYGTSLMSQLQMLSDPTWMNRRRIAMADLSNVQFDPQNPYALFSPDQWSNQFSLFNDKPLPWPSSYAGYPTDAMGNPIGGGPQQQTAAPAAGSSTPGMTINSTPQQGQMTPAALTQALGGGPNAQGAGQWYGNYLAAQAKLTPQQQYAQQQSRALNANAMLFNNQGYQGPGTTFGARNTPLEQQMQGYAMGLGQPQQAAPQQASRPAAAAPGGLTYPQVLALLANPGKVTTPGANVPGGAKRPARRRSQQGLPWAGKAGDEPELPVGPGRASGQGKGLSHARTVRFPSGGDGPA